ncbi:MULTISPECIES: YIEGIA family protein [Bacillaceae]|uniref:YIEGIA family protein n=1 Tax=Bacillaceae TaxID=186817 RepID=UPI000BFCD715|nr:MULTISPECIES: YIEGIA family protein [Bacillaceae]MCM3164334.1 YIEGIA family protein [Metabacillus litoralis]PGT75194.1 YIEGIA protein [Bacillus sp. AFS040349]UGB33725.1 YIEGIA family protein [Metabacillus sp. B2-18]
MKDGVISSEQIALIVTAIIIGTLARVLTIKEDYRQYPSYPNGYLIHLITGFVAAALGAVAIPALMTKNFVAVTFLTLAIQQFRDVRKTERESLKDLENTEYAYRGDAYIDGISKTFEARNYFALIVSFATGLTIQLVNTNSIWINIICGTIVGFIVLFVLKRFSKGKTVGDIANVKEGKVEIKGSELFVDGIYVSNQLGTENARKLFEKEGLAVVIYPREEHFRITLDNYGQRQAILFETTRSVGVKRYHFTRKEYEEGRVVITLVPIINDINKLVETVKNTPLLESAKKSHSVMQTNLAGRK